MTRYQSYDDALIAGRLALAAITPLLQKANAPGAEIRVSMDAAPRSSGGFKFDIHYKTLRVMSLNPEQYSVWGDQTPVHICQSLSELCDRVKIILF